MRIALPNHLRPRRDKFFGPAPEHHLDGNAKARVWAAAGAYNAANRQPGQHQGPLTWATLRVLRALLWRFHGADGGGRCFPSYERIAAAAKCCHDSVCVALRALEDAGLLTWAHRLTRIRRREQDLLGHWGSVWQVIRTSNGYRLLDPLDREPSRRVWCKSENPTGPQSRDLTTDGARLDGARVTLEEPSRAPSVPLERPEVAPQRERGSAVRTPLSPEERGIDRSARHQPHQGRFGHFTTASSRRCCQSQATRRKACRAAAFSRAVFPLARDVDVHRQRPTAFPPAAGQLDARPLPSLKGSERGNMASDISLAAAGTLRSAAVRSTLRAGSQREKRDHERSLSGRRRILPTVAAYHWPPRAVRTPRGVQRLGKCLVSGVPVPCRLSMIGRTLAANLPAPARTSEGSPTAIPTPNNALLSWLCAVEPL
jgi:hypothetical protein